MSIFSKMFGEVEIPQPQTQEERAFLERLSIFVMRNLGLCTKMGLKDLQVTSDEKLVITLVGDKELLKSWFKFFPETKATAEEKLGRKFE